MAEYSIEIQPTETTETFTFGPKEFTYTEGQVLRYIYTNLVVNAEYMLTITVLTVAGNSSVTTNFSKLCRNGAQSYDGSS